MANNSLPTDPPPVLIPTEAETRAFDLENQEVSADLGKTVDTVARPREDQIRSAAYERYLQRGGAPGTDVDDWLEAERAVDERTKRPIRGNPP